MQAGCIKARFHYNPSPTPHAHAETTTFTLFRTTFLDCQLHRHQSTVVRLARGKRPAQITTECTQCQTLAPAKLHLCQLAALELANDLLDLGRRTPASPPPYLLFFGHETTSPQNGRAD
jgi:hypothetical protein